MLSEAGRLMARDLLCAISPSFYLSTLGFQCFEWQKALLDSRHKRKLVNGARRAGKSQSVAGPPCHRARYKAGSFSIVLAAIEKQAWEDINLIRDFAAKDPGLKIVRSSDELVEFANRSRIMVVPATEKGARGFPEPDIIVLDEASRIPDEVYSSGVRPMLTNNPRCTLYAISTPAGREGFFYRAWETTHWERYEVRAPWDVTDDGMQLVPAIPEEQYRAERARKGIRAWYSPRHYDLKIELENLLEMKARTYRQEACVEFVEKEGAAFRYKDIEAMFTREVAPLRAGGTTASALEALTFDE